MHSTWSWSWPFNAYWNTTYVGEIIISYKTAFAIGAGAAFITGGLGYIVRAGISDQEEIELYDMINEATINMFSGIGSFAGVFFGGLLGIKIPGKFTMKNSIPYQIFMGISGFYAFKYVLSLLKKALQEE